MVVSRKKTKNQKTTKSIAELKLDGDDEEHYVEGDEGQDVARQLVEIDAHGLLQAVVAAERINQQDDRDKVEGEEERDVEHACQLDVGVAQGQEASEEVYARQKELVPPRGHIFERDGGIGQQNGGGLEAKTLPHCRHRRVGGDGRVVAVDRPPRRANDLEEELHLEAKAECVISVYQ